MSPPSTVRALVLTPLLLVALAAPSAAAGAAREDGPAGEDAADEAAAREEGLAAETPALAPGVEIVVNIPAGELAVHEGSGLTRVYPVAVGTRLHPTPVGEFALTRAVWNPWWHPPATWWARNERPQPPGPANAMGRAKLSFKPLYFIHGTAETETLGQPASHGCVRMSNADVIDLARLVHRHATPNLDPALLDRLARDPRSTREIALERPVTLRIVYRRAELRGDEVLVHPDVYRRGGSRELAWEIVDALAERGRTVRAADLVPLLDGVDREGGTLSLSELLAAVPSTEAGEAAR
jgi:murein L,D-transpeptidase YcbB/YkuD